MTKGDKIRFVAAMKVTADLYGKEPLSKEALEMFFLLLQKFNLAQVEQALQEHMAVSPFMPKPCDIKSRIDRTPEDRAALAWPLVVNTIRHICSGQSVAFPSPAYNYAIKQMGGWIELCASLRDDKIEWRGKEFARFFMIGEECATWGDEMGKVRVERYCIGRHEANNRRGGYALPEVTDATTGLPIDGFRESLPALNGKVIPMVGALASEMRALS